MSTTAVPVPGAVADQVEDLRLDGHVERGGGLVRQQHARAAGSAMAIMTRWRMPPESWCGYCAGGVPGSGSPGEHLQRAASRPARQPFMDHDRLGDLPATVSTGSGWSSAPGRSSRSRGRGSRGSRPLRRARSRLSNSTRPARSAIGARQQAQHDSAVRLLPQPDSRRCTASRRAAPRRRVGDRDGGRAVAGGELGPQPLDARMGRRPSHPLASAGRACRAPVAGCDRQHHQRVKTLGTDVPEGELHVRRPSAMMLPRSGSPAACRREEER